VNNKLYTHMYIYTSQTTFINHKQPNMSGIRNILQITHSKVHTILSSNVVSSCSNYY
jgi:hypothetical protein